MYSKAIKSSKNNEMHMHYGRFILKIYSRMFNVVFTVFQYIIGSEINAPFRVGCLMYGDFFIEHYLYCLGHHAIMLG